MNVLLVYAHNEPSSFTASMMNLAQSVLGQAGHTIAISDLYGVGFNPVAEKYDFSQMSLDHYNYMYEQSFAAKHDWAYSVDIIDELQKVKEAELILFFFPLWWGGAPAIMKGWFDRVLTMGTAWDDEHIFSTGKYRGKVAGVVVSVGQPESYYNANGIQKASVKQMLFPLLHGTLAFCGFNVLDPFIAHGLSVANEFAIAEQLDAFKLKLEQLETEPRFLYKF